MRPVDIAVTDSSPANLLARAKIVVDNNTIEKITNIIFAVKWAMI
jgi:hypothetical protein